MPHDSRLVSVAILGVLGLSGCQPGSKTLPPSSPPVVVYTAHSPQNAAATNTPAGAVMRQHTPGLMARTLFVSESPGSRHRVETWEMLVGPGKKSEPAMLPGAAVLEIASGTGRIAIAGKSQEVKTGDVVAANEGDSLAFEAQSPGSGLLIRATVVRRAGIQVPR